MSRLCGKTHIRSFIVVSCHVVCACGVVTRIYKTHSSLHIYAQKNVLHEIQYSQRNVYTNIIYMYCYGFNVMSKFLK